MYVTTIVFLNVQYKLFYEAGFVMKKVHTLISVVVILAVLSWFVVLINANAGVTHERQCNGLNSHGYWSYCRVHDYCMRFAPDRWAGTTCARCGCVRDNHQYVSGY